MTSELPPPVREDVDITNRSPFPGIRAEPDAVTVDATEPQNRTGRVSFITVSEEYFVLYASVATGTVFVCHSSASTSCSAEKTNEPPASLTLTEAHRTNAAAPGSPSSGTAPSAASFSSNGAFADTVLYSPPASGRDT